MSFRSITALLCVYAFALCGLANAKLTLYGYVPGRYVEGKGKNDLVLSKIVIDKRVIQSVEEIKKDKVPKRSKPGEDSIVLKRKGADDFDVIYPGLIDLHNHTKQNNLPVWSQAQGQFANRFEWRAWSDYKYSVSGNMNPWIGFGKPITCAAFRWSEMQAMVLGTTYLQGPSSCVDNFAIHRVEDRDSYVSKKDGVQAPTDLVLPGELVFVWNTVLPEMFKMAGQDPALIKELDKKPEVLDKVLKKATYDDALLIVLKRHCEGLKELKDVTSDASLDILSDQDKLKKACGVDTAEDKDNLPDKFIRYVYWVHKGLMKKREYLQSKDKSGVIGHLAEGRRFDPYNKIEFDLIRILGLDLPGLNFVHAVGVNEREFKVMGKKGMGLIWSPFSNILLYGETVDLKAAHKAGVTIALGSDWLPTGSRSVLDELKIAREYVRKEKLNRTFTDEYLFDMVTTNPAQLIGHGETDKEKGEAAVGTIEVGAMGTLISVSLNNKRNPYTNLVTAYERDVNLVVVDGKPVYGNESLVTQYDASESWEQLPDYLAELSQLKTEDFPEQPSKMKKKEKLAFLEKMGKESLKVTKTDDECKFEEPKLFAHQSTHDDEKELADFEKNSGLNLDRFNDIQRLIGVNLMTQNRNLTDEKKGKPEFAIKYFPSLYSCNDKEYLDRTKNFVIAGSKDEYEANASNRIPYRKRDGLGSKPKRMAKDYGLPFE